MNVKGANKFRNLTILSVVLVSVSRHVWRDSQVSLSFLWHPRDFLLLLGNGEV